MLNTPHEESQPILNLAKKCPTTASWLGVYPDYLTPEVSFKSNRSKSPIPDSVIEKIVYLFNSGELKRTIASECGVSYSTVVRAVRNL